MPTFDHDRMEVYQLARAFNVRANAITTAVSKGHSDLLDQLRRAGASVALNIAEGSGEYLPKEKARFYRIARRSATESAAVLDLLVDLELVPAKEAASAKEVLARVVGMLVRLIKGIHGAD
ncbi:MAG TPA: four helix bundle protein [Longimicrobiales bacterium]|nr:four helix bundle protein [Longimicrobiales bacterium]